MTYRTTLVTGGSSGIGAATARALAADGNAVWLTYSTGGDAAAAVAERCREAGAPEVRTSRLDLRDPASIDALVAEVEQTWSSLHVLVNNAGVCPYRDLDEIELDEWDAVMETNVRGPFQLTRALLPALRRADGDRAVVNVSSIAGQVGAIATGMHYAASKGALLALTRSLAKRLAPEGIRVNAVTPGAVESAITAELTDGGRAKVAAGIPLGRFGHPDEIAWIIRALSSPSASFVTGATYDANGGARID